MDVVYFTLVTVTTVGYGDIVPVSERARLLDALLVTPVRLLVWMIFLGTTYELLVQRALEDYRMLRLQKKMTGHVIICGYGSVGRFAAAELVRQGHEPGEIVVVDSHRTAADQAAGAGHTTLHGSATREEILAMAGAERADAIIVCMDSDEATALVVLTAREMSSARIVVKINEEENRKLMRRSGADQIITIGSLGGSLIAGGVSSDMAVEFVGDLVSREGRVHLTQRKALPEEIGKPASAVSNLVMLRRPGSEPVCGEQLRTLLVEREDEVLYIRYS